MTALDEIINELEDNSAFDLIPVEKQFIIEKINEAIASMIPAQWTISDDGSLLIDLVGTHTPDSGIEIMRDGILGVQLTPGNDPVCVFYDADGIAIFQVSNDGSLNGKTGKSLVFNL
jgi:hypothetical protein